MAGHGDGDGSALGSGPRGGADGRLLEVSPEHRGLLLAAAKGFTGYAYLLHEQGDRIEGIDRAPNLRFVNTIARRRARWLETRIPALFIESDLDGLTVPMRLLD